MAPEDRTDQEFVAGLRLAVERYMGAVDQWEAAYRKYYRLPGYAAKISFDLEAEHREYSGRRDELQRMLPRARRLCLKHRLRDPFAGLVRITLGRYAPQHRVDSAIGRNERNAATACLVDLAAACQEWAAPGATAPGGTAPGAAATRPETRKGTWLRRLIGYFY